MDRPYPKIFISEKAERVLRSGHPWVYGEEIVKTQGEPEDGELVDAFSKKERYLGTGFYNSSSKIRVRIISNNCNDKFDRAFWERRVRWAVEYRAHVMGEKDFSCCRLIFGEADRFPGLTVDRFGDVLVSEVLCLGMEKIKDIIYKELTAVLAGYGVAIKALYERNDSKLRDKEGIPKYCGFYKSEGLAENTDGHVIITENRLDFDVDYVNGQKTGFFLDQKYNRAAAARLARGRRVLDCFTHTGAFALNCAAAGSESVTAADVSEEALKSASRNAALNGLTGKVSFVNADIFDLLTEMARSGVCPYDYIILDPPAFTKSSDTAKNAYRGYKEINMKAMKLLPRGGYLATCSCSHFMPDELFCRMLAEAAKDADVSLRQIFTGRQSPDHPILWGVPETDYLKFYIFQVV